MKQPQTGLYIHWPFCAKKCPYCDFNTYVRQEIDEQLWVSAYLREIESYSEDLGARQIDTIFFGGGTPSLMKPENVGQIIDHIQKLFPIANDIEITLEVNPTSVEIEKFEGFRTAGVNRVSLGLQSFDDEALKFLGRGHNATEGVAAIETAQRVFDRSSFDLIYARPDQTLEQWKGELERAVDLHAGHLSLYQLTIEPSTPFYKLHQRGDFEMPAEEKGADFYTLTQEVLSAAGLHRYEVSNHAREGQEARHNIIYWHYDDYIGIGPGAHGRVNLGQGHAATYDFKSPEKWLESVEEKGHGREINNALPPYEQFTEGFMMGMRLAEGLDLHKLANKTGIGWGDVLQEDKLYQAVNENWIAMNDNHIKATDAGIIRLNGLLRFLMKAV